MSAWMHLLAIAKIKINKTCLIIDSEAFQIIESFYNDKETNK